MGFFSCHGAPVVSLVLLLALCCATSSDARTALFFNRLEATNQGSVFSRCVTHLKRPIPMTKQASGAQLAKHFVESELRWAPSGPDPMHHHASPKRPQAP